MVWGWKTTKRTELLHKFKIIYDSYFHYEDQLTKYPTVYYNTLFDKICFLFIYISIQNVGMYLSSYSANPIHRKSNEILLPSFGKCIEKYLSNRMNKGFPNSPMYRICDITYLEKSIPCHRRRTRAAKQKGRGINENTKNSLSS